MNTLGFKNASPETLNAWRYASGLIAYNTLTPLFFNGACAASEFLVYNAAKIYFALSLSMCHNSGAAVAGAGVDTFYDEADALAYYGFQNYPGWDATAAAFKYVRAGYTFNNIVFSRINNLYSTYMIFNGYRLTIV